VAAGTAVSVILGALLAPLTLLLPYAGAPEPAMEAWRPRARKAWPLLAAANGFLSMGVLTGLAAPLIPWSSENGDFTGVTMPGALWYSYYSFSSYSSYTPPQTVPNPFLLGGSVSIFLGILFCLIAWGLGLWAAARVRGVAVHGARTGGEGCCVPSMPAIQGLVWTGFLYCLSGAAANWTLTSILLTPYSYSSYSVLSGPSGSKASSPGGGLLAFSIACLFISAILYSVTGCCGKCLHPPSHPFPASTATTSTTRTQNAHKRDHPCASRPLPSTLPTKQRWGRCPAWARRAPTAAAWSATAPSRRRRLAAAAPMPPRPPRSKSCSFAAFTPRAPRSPGRWWFKCKRTRHNHALGVL
jgi:hypothetical protein